jgi:hypothetical protein
MIALKDLKACCHGLHQNVEALRGRTVKIIQDNMGVVGVSARCHPSSQNACPKSRVLYLDCTNTRFTWRWSPFAAKQIWQMHHRVRGGSTCGPCSSPHNKSTCSKSSHSAAFNGLLLDWSPVFTLWLNPRRAFRQSRGATAGSGLRLCVKDEVLQVCVLLTTQGVHSRIRWSSSQDYQHVISSDIRPYNKKLLGTSPALHQEVTLPVNFMMRTISPTSPVFEAAVRLLHGGRRPSTVKSYDQEWLKFEAFTSQAKNDAGAPRMCALPASSQTVVAYLGYLLEAGTISEKKLQPYLSGINAVHNNFEYRPVDISSSWFANASLNYKTPPCFNHSRSRCFL